MILLSAKCTFYKWFYTPKNPTELGRLIRDYQPAFYSAIKNAMSKTYITPDLLLEFSVISRNKQTIDLALKQGAKLDKLAPPFGIEIRRKRYPPILHALFDNNIALFEDLTKDNPDALTTSVIRMLLKGMTQDRVRANTVVAVLEQLKDNIDTSKMSVLLFNIIVKRDEKFIQKSILNFSSVKSLITHDFIISQNYDAFLQLGPYVVKFLLSKLDKNTPDTMTFINKLLIHGSAINAPDFCELLIEFGADVNYTHEKMIRPETPLSESLRSGNLGISDMLLDKGAKTTYSERNYHNLIDAIHGGLEETALNILENDPNINFDILSKSLHFGIESPHKFSLKLYDALLVRGADPLYSESGFFNSMNALYSAIVRSKIDAFVLFVETIRSRHKEKKCLANGITHLLYAYTDPRFSRKHEDEEKIGELLTKYAEFFSQQQINEALFIAAERGREHACHVFLTLGGDPNYLHLHQSSQAFNSSKNTTTSLIQAIREEQYATAQLLIDRGAKVPESAFKTLDTMASNGDLYGLRFLMRAGGIIPTVLSNDDALTVTACETWSEVLDEITEADAYLLPYVLPRYFQHLNITPMDYLNNCPQWHKIDVIKCLHSF